MNIPESHLDGTDTLVSLEPPTSLELLSIVSDLARCGTIDVDELQIPIKMSSPPHSTCIGAPDPSVKYLASEFMDVVHSHADDVYIQNELPESSESLSTSLSISDFPLIAMPSNHSATTTPPDMHIDNMIYHASSPLSVPATSISAYVQNNNPAYIMHPVTAIIPPTFPMPSSTINAKSSSLLSTPLLPALAIGSNSYNDYDVIMDSIINTSNNYTLSVDEHHQDMCNDYCPTMHLSPFQDRNSLFDAAPSSSYSISPFISSSSNYSITSTPPSAPTHFASPLILFPSKHSIICTPPSISTYSPINNQSLFCSPHRTYPMPFQYHNSVLDSPTVSPYCVLDDNMNSFITTDSIHHSRCEITSSFQQCAPSIIHKASMTTNIQLNLVTNVHNHVIPSNSTVIQSESPVNTYMHPTTTSNPTSNSLQSIHKLDMASVIVYVQHNHPSLELQLRPNNQLGIATITHMPNGAIIRPLAYSLCFEHGQVTCNVQGEDISLGNLMSFTINSTAELKEYIDSLLDTTKQCGGISLIGQKYDQIIPDMPDIATSRGFTWDSSNRTYKAKNCERINCHSPKGACCKCESLSSTMYHVFRRRLNNHNRVKDRVSYLSHCNLRYLTPKEKQQRLNNIAKHRRTMRKRVKLLQKKLKTAQNEYNDMKMLFQHAEDDKEKLQEIFTKCPNVKKFWNKQKEVFHNYEKGQTRSIRYQYMLLACCDCCN